MKYVEHIYDKSTKVARQEVLDGPTDLWYIKAERGEETYYFPTCASFSNWHGGNCETSGMYTRMGRYQDWKISFYLTE